MRARTDALPPGRHSRRGIRHAQASRSAALGAREEPGLRFSRFDDWVVGPCGHALALTLDVRHDQSRAPSLPGRSGRRDRRYYEPLGLPSGTRPFRHRLIGPAFARRAPPGRVSPVPCRAVAACSPPYPGDVLRRSGSRRRSLLPSPWHERLGRPSLSGASLSGLQGFTLSHWACGFALRPKAIQPAADLRRPAQT
jgi:hypothetical protein